MAAVDDVDKVIEQYHLALGEPTFSPTMTYWRKLQVRKLSSSSQDSGATRVDHIRFENLTKEIHRMQARAKAP